MKLSDCPIAVSIANILNQDGAWRRVMNFLRPEFYKQEDIMRFETFSRTTGMNPGELLVDDLSKQGLTVENLLQIAQALDLRLLLSFLCETGVLPSRDHSGPLPFPPNLKLLFVSGETEARNAIMAQPSYSATFKVALLIANKDYEEGTHHQLTKPCADVHALGNQLDDLGFHVLALFNLSSIEILNAITYVATHFVLPGSYIVFYYSGHGFDWEGQSWLLPVDGSAAVPQRFIEQEFLKREPALCLELLDSCRVPPPMPPREAWNVQERCPPPPTLVKCFATSSLSPIYENISASLGPFVDQLHRHVSRPVPVVDMLQATLQAFQKSEPYCVPSLESTLQEIGRSLTDPVINESPEKRQQIQELCAPPADITISGVEIWFSKLRDTFCNALQIHVSRPVMIMHNEIPLTVMDESGMVYCLQGLQKIKGEVKLNVVVNKEVHDVNLKPFMASKMNLWLNHLSSSTQVTR
ncbi:unnamed protein product [Darwinula stevensoni]|uniref:Caspase family p20 domain-containing protein n=1 Tax=Darwinula stevensoni TaxID=69355 RepID=A0A7R8X749_9CRUS|nr:unnamed protein product [Darwinula stevensoni]CAG0888826.1 unnamed protein product [Darwinula stevensoni]